MINFFKIPELKYSILSLQKALFEQNCSNNMWGQYGSNKKNSLYSKYADMNQPEILAIITQFKDYNLLIENVKFLKTLAQNKISPHKDKRNAAISIPVNVNKKQELCFYREQNNFKTRYLTINGKIKKNAYQVYDSNKATLTKTIYPNKNTICINTNTIHSIKNNTNEDRVILSISFKKKYDCFFLINKMYNSGNLLC